VDCYAGRELYYLEHRNLCAEPECERDSLGYTLQLSVRCGSTTAKFKCDGGLLQNRRIDTGLDPGANGSELPNSDADSKLDAYTDFYGHSYSYINARCHRNSYSHCNIHSYSDSHCNTNSHCYCDCNSQCYCYSYCDRHGYSYCNRDCNTDCDTAAYANTKVESATETSPHASASSVAVDDRLVERVIPWPAVASAKATQRVGKHYCGLAA
jgi:hypothetical protein